ncbi:MAG TPA: alpha/beta hydrolase [Cellvibrio sp.]|nr:alpha/beta hydrolase [Cellvibrio sp.]
MSLIPVEVQAYSILSILWSPIKVTPPHIYFSLVESILLVIPSNIHIASKGIFKGVGMNKCKKIMLGGLLLMCFRLDVNAKCTPGIYSDDSENVAVLRNKSTATGSQFVYLTLDGLFGDVDSQNFPFQCNENFLRLNSSIRSVLRPVAIRRITTSFTSANTRLVGELIEPQELSKKYPLVVMVHGSEQTAAIGNAKARLMVALGIAVFVYDKRGTGESEGFYTQNFELLATDAAAALEHARKLAGDRFGRAGFWGESQGGWVAPLAGNRSSADFVVVGYGLTSSPIDEDLDQMLLEAESQGLSKKHVQQIKKLSVITAKILTSNFERGLKELETLKKILHSESWTKTIHGEYSGAMLRMNKDDLRRFGPALFDNLELIWNYDSTAVLEKTDIPMLWIVADKDREAPAKRTITVLTGLKKQKAKTGSVFVP